MLDFRRLRKSLQKFTGNLRLFTASQTGNPAGSTSATADSGQLVLVVDDQRTNRTLLVRLISMLGYAAEATESGAMALIKWQSGRFALLITDCHMTEMDGYALTRHIRSIESRDGLHRMPIIAWTSITQTRMDPRCAAAGMDDHLPKPVDLEALSSLLERWLPSAGKPPTERTIEIVTETPASTVADAILDRAVLTRYSSGDTLMEQEILHEFRTANSADIALFKDALAQRDPLLVAQAAHRIKGASRMIGANAFAAICERLEKNGRAADWNAIAINEKLFIQALDKLNEALNSC